MTKHKKTIGDKLLFGRDEWFALPKLKIPAIKGKIDTGAKTSSIHAANIKLKRAAGKKIVSFDVYPLQGNTDVVLQCRAAVCDQRLVMSSNGHKENRYVIKTIISIAGQLWEIEMTLSDREPLRYRLLIGRETLKNRVLINPSLSCNQQKMAAQSVQKKYYADT